jgi:hypothetical protein
MAWNLKPPQPVDVDLMLRKASRRVCLGQFLKQGDRHMNVLSRRQLDLLINQAIADTVQRLREEGALTLARTEARLATESRRELDSLLQRVEELTAAAPEAEVFLADGEEERERRLTRFENENLEAGRGLDLGSVHICAGARSRATGQMLVNVERNAFLEVRADGFTQSLLRKFGIGCVVRGQRAYIVGARAFELATIFDKVVRQPLKEGAGYGSEPEGALLAQHLLEQVLGRPRMRDEICVYSIPGEPVDTGRNFIYHQGVLENALRALGYTPRPMIESHVIIQSEFREQEYTGIGITCGGGTFNVCVACKGVPALTFSTSRGGEWVDRSVAKAIGMPEAQVCSIKERGMHLYRPEDPVEGAVAIYYRHLLQDLLETFKRKIGEAEWVPSFTKPVDIVCAGGTALVGGFIDLFREELHKAQLPIAVAEVRLAENPLEAVVAGCLRAAQEETRAMEEDPVDMTPSVRDRAASTTTTMPTARPIRSAARGAA